MHLFFDSFRMRLIFKSVNHWHGYVIFKFHSSQYWNQDRIRISLDLSEIFLHQQKFYVTWNFFDNHLFPQNFFGLQKFFKFSTNLFTFDQTLIINLTEDIFSQKWKSSTNSLHIDFSSHDCNWIQLQNQFL